MSDKYKKELYDLEITPDEKLWKNIKTNIPKSKFNWLAFSTITGGTIVVALATIIALSPEKKEKQNILTDNTQLLDNKVVLEQNEKILEVEKNDINADKVKESNKNLAGYKITEPNQAQSYTNNNHIEFSINNNEVNNIEINNVAPKLIENKVKPVVVKANLEESNQEKSNVNSSTYNNLKFVLYIPNAFTPHQATNNIFKPEYAELKSYEMKIFSKQGQLIFSSRDIAKGWDGRYRGKYCEGGTYQFIIKYETFGGQSEAISGRVNLLTNY